jgi:hypothetical protein
MTDFDPDRFEAEKYREYFPQLQRAYRNAFETMNEAYDSELVHAIDQQVLNESEPVFEDGEFRIDLPGDPVDRVTAIVVDETKLTETVERYREELRRELRRVFDVESATRE